jgi:Uncharacterised nucleotidyltransferase
VQHHAAKQYGQEHPNDYDILAVVLARLVRDVEARVVLLGARADLDQVRERELASFVADAVDWGTVVGLAVREGTAPLLHSHLRRLDLLKKLPPLAAHQLAEAANAVWAMSVVGEDRWAEATSALTRAGVQALTLKGMALAHTVYADPGVRPMADIDLLVRPADRAAALEVLHALGYRTPGPDADRLAASRSFAELIRDGTRIDLHWHVARYLRFEGVVRIDHDGLWRRARPLVTPRGWSLALCPEDLVLHLILHLTLGSEFTRVLWYADIDAVVRHYAAELDWDRLVAEADRWRIRALAAFTLGLVGESFDTPLPRGLLERLQCGRVRRAAVARCIDSSAPPSLGPQPGDTRVYLAQTLLMDRPVDVFRLLAWTFFPSRTWLRFHYQIEATWRIAVYRAIHPFRVCCLAAKQLW